MATIFLVLLCSAWTIFLEMNFMISNFFVTGSQISDNSIVSLISSIYNKKVWYVIINFRSYLCSQISNHKTMEIQLSTLWLCYINYRGHTWPFFQCCNMTALIWKQGPIFWKFLLHLQKVFGNLQYLSIFVILNLKSTFLQNFPICLHSGQLFVVWRILFLINFLCYFWTC